MQTAITLFEDDYCLTRDARRRNRARIKDGDQRLRKLVRDEKRVSQLRWKLPEEPLAEPYQRGWKKLHVLHPDVARSPEAAFFQALLDKINRIEYSRYPGCVRRYGRKTHRDNRWQPDISLRTFWFDDFHAADSCLTSAEKKYFRPEPYWEESVSTMRVQYVFSQPWRFEVKVLPNIVTHAKVLDIDLEQEAAWYDKMLDARYLRNRADKVMHGRVKYYNWTLDAEWRVNPLKQQPVLRIIEDATAQIEQPWTS